MSAESLSNLSPEKQLESFDTVLMPEESPADIKTKLVVVLINLKAKHLVKVIWKKKWIYEKEPADQLVETLLMLQSMNNRFKPQQSQHWPCPSLHHIYHIYFAACNK